MAASLNVTFLRDNAHGGSDTQLSTVAAALADFVAAARSSVDIAIYDFRLADADAVKVVVGALTDAADRGVVVRIGFDAGKPAAADFTVLEADPAPPGTAEWVAQHFEGTGVQTKPIQAGGQLMHSKYILRDALDGQSETAAVWTGSTNFTDDAWTRQENNVLVVTNPVMAASYRTDFDQMWTTGRITGAGAAGSGSSTAGTGTIGWDFCPGDGTAINTALAARVRGARTRLVVASMVLTSPQVLQALAAAITRGVSLTGIYDGGQMDPIVARWRTLPRDATILAHWTAVSNHLVAKPSSPYTPDGVHDFMHLKVLLADDTVTTGSYNFSTNAERNAENQLHLDDASTVGAYADYLAAVIAAYSH